ncbi:hypothetical protein [Nocardia amamiensis]|uniref:hypothetical protein n=1 Tax=Nocardia amamiensis TaxID=404578 RepID=UPI000833A7A4|nr:hypothetical protein [Nocardia amamiensis]
MPEFRTREQVEQYLAQIFSPDQEYRIYQFEHGWVCRPILTPQQTANGQGLGLGNYVVNAKTGVVTAHASLAPTMIGEMYDEAIRNGQPVQGYQVYPPQWRVTIERTREDSQEIEYLLRATSLTEPPEPSIEHQLVINKHTLRFSPTDSTSANAVSWAEMRNRTDGTWPQHGTFEF